MRSTLSRSPGPIGGRLHLTDLAARAAHLVRQAALGFPFLVVSLASLYLLRHVLAQPMWVATLIGGALGLLAESVVDNGRRHPARRALLRYQASALPNAATWFVVANLLSALSVEYLLAAISGQVAAAAVGVLLSSEPCEHLVHQAAVLTGEPIAAPTAPSGVAASEVARARREALAYHLLPAAFLVGAAAFVFHLTLFFGYRLLGNSDRLNHYLSFILYHTHYLRAGPVQPPGPTSSSTASTPRRCR